MGEKVPTCFIYTDLTENTRPRKPEKKGSGDGGEKMCCGVQDIVEAAAAAAVAAAAAAAGAGATAMAVLCCDAPLFPSSLLVFVQKPRGPEDSDEREATTDPLPATTRTKQASQTDASLLPHPTTQQAGVFLPLTGFDAAVAARREASMLVGARQRPARGRGDEARRHAAVAAAAGAP